MGIHIYAYSRPEPGQWTMSIQQQKGDHLSKEFALNKTQKMIKQNITIHSGENFQTADVVLENVDH